MKKNTIATQWPDENELRRRETLKAISKKQYTNKMTETEDLVEEELIRQLKA